MEIFNKDTQTPDLKNDRICEKILDNMDVGIFFTDCNRNIIFWNNAATALSGYCKEEVLGRSCFATIFSHAEDGEEILSVHECPLNSAILRGEISESIIYIRHKEGYRIKVRAKATPIYDNGEIIGAFEELQKLYQERVEVKEHFEDGQEIKEKEYSVEDLKVLALYDQLTGLPNRRYLESFLKSKLMEFGLLQLGFGILFMDIDNFSTFNNNYGHNLGDKVLQMVSRTFVNLTRKTDLIGRWGGEEFVAIFSMVSKLELEIIAEKIRLLIEKSVLKETPDQEYRVTVSIGGTIVQESDDLNSIVERADAQMYISKKTGKNRVTII